MPVKLLTVAMAIVLALGANTHADAGASSAGRTGATPARPLEDLASALGLVPLPGQSLPKFSLPRLDGGQLSSGDLQGRAALLYFWASW